MKKLLFSLLCGAALSAAAVPFQAAKDGEANAVIIIGYKVHPAVQFAAQELQNSIRIISTARLPIINAPFARQQRIYLGTLDDPNVKQILKKYPKDRKALSGNDGYAVRMGGRSTLYIYASTPKGVLNGVHRFIYKNTDLVWVRPYKETVISSYDPNLTFKQTDYVDIPKFSLRGWGVNGNISLRSAEYDLYISRLANNYTVSPSVAVQNRRDALDFILEFGGGHNLAALWLPVKKYGETNPEFYMLIDGKRRSRDRNTQLCYSNEEMTKVFIKDALEIIKNMPPMYKRVNMMIEDTPAFCECENCTKPITLPDGRVLKKEDPAYKSTLFYMFLNKVAEAVCAKYPKMQIKTFAYFFTAIPPEIKVHPAICLSFCPYVRNDKQTLHGKTNVNWLQRTVKWAKMSPNVIWREYYFCQAAFPRAQANIIAQDLRFINKLGIRMIYPELSWGDLANTQRRGFTDQEVYDMNSPEFWVINQLFWDPEQDPDKLRQEYLTRTYREAAPAMIKFYKYIGDAWLNDPAPSAFNDDFRRSMGVLIVDKKLDKPCLDALAEAAKLVKDPRSKLQIEKVTATFKRWLSVAVSGKSVSQNVNKVAVKEFPGFDFDKGVWSKASTLAPLRVMGVPTAQPKEPTDVKLLHNGTKLYLAFRCPYPGKLDAKAKRRHDEWPGGDHVEIFIAHQREGHYFHFAFDANGNSYEALGTNADWNTEWEVKTQVKDGEWRAVVAIPVAAVGAKLEQNNKVRALIYRCRPMREGEKGGHQHSTWGGGKVHSADSFGELVFSHEEQ